VLAIVLPIAAAAARRSRTEGRRGDASGQALVDGARDKGQQAGLERRGEGRLKAPT